MPSYEPMNAYRRRSAGRRWLSAVLPWVFVAGVVAATNLPVRRWIDWPWSRPADSQAARDAEMVWKRSTGADVRRGVDVVRTIDGDTFEARVHLDGGLEAVTRVRLRGIDAPELKSACDKELQ